MGEEPTLHVVEMQLCSLCLDGAGGECHTPGCILWINRAHDLSLRDHPMLLSVDGVPVGLHAEADDEEPQYIDDSVQLSNKACPRYYGRKRCQCPEGRCWYDENVARRRQGLKAVERPWEPTGA